MKKQKPPRTVRLYPPVEEKWAKLNQEDNFNFYVNYCMAEKLGVAVDINEYRRPKK